MLGLDETVEDGSAERWKRYEELMYGDAWGKNDSDAKKLEKCCRLSSGHNFL